MLGRSRQKREFDQSLVGLQAALTSSNQDVERLSNEVSAAQRALADADSRADARPAIE